MQRCAEAGALLAPLNPGFYLLPKTIDEIVDFMAAKMLDLLGVEHELDVRWDERIETSKRRNVETSKRGG